MTVEPLDERLALAENQLELVSKAINSIATTLESFASIIFKLSQTNTEVMARISLLEDSNHEPLLEIT